ncbi:MAG: PorV/PorQ family protein [Elusimicrobiota bacterium]|nr:PorV/PorQ family protein [Elusimicrobiota bacterium]
MRAFLAAALALPLALPAGASDFGRAAVGTSGAEFMLFDTSARGIAMGGAYSVATNDAASLYWNPAGLAQVPRFSATFLHSQYIAGITYNAASVAKRINDTSVLAFGVRYLDVGAIDRTDINGQTRGEFHPRSYLAELGWGQSIYDLSDSEMDVSMGVTVKYLKMDILEHAAAYGGDFGIHSRFYGTSHTYDMAMTIQNLGIGPKFDRKRDTLPTRLRFGGGLRPIKPLLLTVEAIAPINNLPHGAGGMEYTLDIQKNIQGAVRAGINSLTYDSLGLTSMLNFGFGVKLSDLSFDYAFAPTGELGAQVHRVSVSFNLPAKISRRYRER